MQTLLELFKKSFFTTAAVFHALCSALMISSVRISLKKFHSRSSFFLFFKGTRKKKRQGRGEGHTESIKAEVHVQQKKRLTSEETPDFEVGEQDQGKRSCLSIPVPSSQVTFWLRAEP